MVFKELRGFVELLESQGELKRISSEVDAHLEIGALSRLGLDHRSPAMLLENVRGHPGYRVLANLLGPTKPVTQGRVALALGLPKDTPPLKLIDQFAERIRERVKPIVVSSSPCKEVIRCGDQVDLTLFPVPFIHALDGGPFFGTWHVDVTKDPDTGWVNWGTYRHMLLGRQTLAYRAVPASHGGSIFYNKYEARGKEMPMAIAVGTDPVSFIAASTGIPAQVDEVEVAGALQGEPVELVQCETIDLLVPASAEIVLEGYVIPNERQREGAFGEYTGYSARVRELHPVFHVTCITHRRDPILTMTNPGKVWDDCATHQSISLSAVLANELRARGLPFEAVYMPVSPPMGVIASVKPQYVGFAHTIASAIWATKVGINSPMVLVVGDDIDVTNLEDVFWCLVTRMHPDRGIHVTKGTPIVTLWPFLSQTDRQERMGARVLFDATFPYGVPKEEQPIVIDLERGWPEDVRSRALERWRTLWQE